MEWSELVRETRAEEGDLVRMLSRTGESLLQIAGLQKAQAAAARVAARPPKQSCASQCVNSSNDQGESMHLIKLFLIERCARFLSPS